MGVYDRNENYPDRKPNLWIRYSVDEETRAKFGLPKREQREPANVGGDKTAAKQVLAARRRELRDGSWRPYVDGGGAKLLVQHYAERWIEARKKAGIVSVRDDEQRLEDYVLVRIGKKPIDEVKRDDMKALVQWLMSLPKTKSTNRPMSPRMVHHVYWTAHNMFEEALREERILRNPCTLEVRPGELPKKKEADPRWRMNAIFTRAEIEILISDERVPLQRRVLYALTYFLYTRFGEAAGRTLRDYDPVAEPLGQMQVPTQYEDEDTKTEVPRMVPVHPVLARILAEWFLEGFPRLFGRKPTPDDYIVPKLRGQGPQNVKRAWQNLQKDLRTLGLRPRRMHDLRRTAISLSLADGADKYLLKWVTHGPQKSDAFDLYNTPPWAALCKQVACMKVGLRGAKLSRLPAASAGASRRTLRRTLPKSDHAKVRNA